ncbi:MAG: hypothetical protein RLW61_04190 [Gammaproteobacteria bacterium]
MKRLLVVLDFDGLLLDSYAIIRDTFADFALDVGDEQRFRNRRKFLKYFGGGREMLGNLTRFALPKKRRLRTALTAHYRTSGRLFTQFVPYINACIAAPAVHIGIVSRNFTLEPGATIRHVLRTSGVAERDLDFVIPLSVGSSKDEVVAAMASPRYHVSLLAGDEIGDYRAALRSGYTPLVASYGFDAPARLRMRGEVPEELLFATPETLAARLWQLSALYLDADAPARPVPAQQPELAA